MATWPRFLLVHQFCNKAMMTGIATFPSLHQRFGRGQTFGRIAMQQGGGGTAGQNHNQLPTLVAEALKNGCVGAVRHCLL